ncbi:hypothetical protein HYX08_05340 [Candidatus Woesearchaeota archaeon]|nr:hypothetical protein [Candidatus Woesearchaeota archaeon]
MKEENNGLFFVQIKEPTDIRRNILETLKEIVEVLQRFEKFKHLRHEKLNEINKLRSQLKDANKMLGALRLKLPQTNLRAVAVRASPAKKTHHKKTKKAKAAAPAEKIQKKEPTELEKLEAELSAIEGKLKSLA